MTNDLTERDREVIEACAKEVEQRGKVYAEKWHEFDDMCKAYAWDSLQHAIAIRALPIPDLLSSLPKIDSSGKGEAVAWMYVLDGIRCLTLDEDAYPENRLHGTPLYAAPVAQPDAEREVCPDCNGFGERPYMGDMASCRTCYGSGKKDRRKAKLGGSRE